MIRRLLHEMPCDALRQLERGNTFNKFRGIAIELKQQDGTTKRIELGDRYSGIERRIGKGRWFHYLRQRARAEAEKRKRIYKMTLELGDTWDFAVFDRKLIIGRQQLGLAQVRRNQDRYNAVS
jgi:hypothetical protein